MQPDRRFDFQLEAELAAAGAMARAATDQAPAPAFTSGLRSHLLTAHAAAGAARGIPRRRSGFARLAPLLAAMLALVLATVVAAGAFRLFGPPPTPPAAPTPQPVVAGLTGGATFTPTPTPSPSPSPTPTPSPSPSPTPTPEPTPAPTPEPTPVPTPQPTPVPTRGANPGDGRDVPRPHRLPGRGRHRVVADLRWDVREVPHAPQRVAGDPDRLSAAGRQRRGGDGQVGHDHRRQRRSTPRLRPA